MLVKLHCHCRLLVLADIAFDGGFELLPLDLDEELLDIVLECRLCK